MIEHLLIDLFVIFVLYLLNKKASFNKTSVDLSTSPANPLSESTVIIFYAPWCGYCKRSMPQFKEAVSKAGGKITMMSSEEPGTKDLMTKYNVRSFPTIIKGNGEIFKGSRDVNSILEFANSR